LINRIYFNYQSFLTYQAFIYSKKLKSYFQISKFFGRDLECENGIINFAEVFFNSINGFGYSLNFGFSKRFGKSSFKVLFKYTKSSPKLSSKDFELGFYTLF
jgi:hypothetical protein